MAHRTIAEESGCAYFSLADAMGGLENLKQWEKKGWSLPGGKRLSEAGYTHLADKLTQDIFLLFDRERFERQRAERTGALGPTRFATLNALWNFVRP